MKYVSFLLAITTLLSCNQKEKELQLTSDFDFIIGDWERTNNKEGITTLEHWKIISPRAYKGHGYAIEKKDTIFQEWMTLYKVDSLWTLKVSGVNEDPVSFIIKNRTNNSFQAENPDHDFPTKIEYSYFDDTLSAKVSNEEMTIPFIFWRVEN